MRAAYLVLALCLFGVGVNATGGLGAAKADHLAQFESLVQGLSDSIMENIQSQNAALNNMFPGMSETQANMSKQFASVQGDVQTLVSSLEAKFCTPASFVPPSKVPASFVGPSFDLTFSTGKCTFNTTKFLLTGAKELDCEEPAITFVKAPATFTSKHHTPATFTSKTCNVTKAFGVKDTHVLYVFDGSKQIPSPQELTAQITSEVRGLLGSMSNAITAPYNAIKKLAHPSPSAPSPPPATASGTSTGATAGASATAGANAGVAPTGTSGLAYGGAAQALTQMASTVPADLPAALGGGLGGGAADLLGNPDVAAALSSLIANANANHGASANANLGASASYGAASN